MKHPTSTLISLFGLGALLLNSSDAAAQARTPLTVVADTGVVTLGPNQVLRLTAVSGARRQRTVTVRFRETTYAPGVCTGRVCIHAVVSSHPYGLLTLAGGAAASLEIANTAHGVRGVVSSDSPGLRVLAEIVDATTGQVVDLALQQNVDD